MCAVHTPSTPTAECLAARLPELVRLLEARGYSRHDAEEAAATAVLAGYRRLKSGRADTLTNRRGWLYRVAHRAAVRQAKRRLLTLPFDEIERLPHSKTADIALFEALELFPPAVREVIAFYFVEGHTCKETAARFGMTVGALRGRIQRAVVELRRQLRDDVSHDSHEKSV